MSPTIFCPRCHSTKITARNYARTTESAGGTAAGAVGSAAAALGGYRNGAAISVVAGPPGARLGGIASALTGA